MLRPFLSAAVALAGLPFLVSPAPAPAPQVSTGPSVSAALCANKIKREPVLVVDITGGTIAGAFHKRLSVYNDGLATVSKNINLPAQVDAQTAFVSAAVVAQLQLDLIAANAHTLCDQQGTFADIPLTTVTAFKGATDARAHTFSYYDGFSFNVYNPVNTVINNFFAAHFPGF